MLYTRKPVVLAFVISALAFSSAWAQAPNPPWQFCIDGSCSVLAGPDTPANFTAVSGGATTISLSWAPGGNGAAPTAYRIARSLSAGSGYADIYTGMGTAGTGDTRTYSNTGRTAGVTYCYRIWAQTGAAESAAYASANAATSDTQAAADFIIPANTADRTYNGTINAGMNGAQWRTVGGVNRLPAAGDIIELAAGTHGLFEFTGLVGAVNNRITIRGPQTGSTPATIRSNSLQTSGPRVLFLRCRYINFDGQCDSSTIPASGITGRQKRRGIRLLPSTPATTANKEKFQWAIKFRGADSATYQNTRDITIRYVEIDGGCTANSATRVTDNNGSGSGISTNDQPNDLASPFQYQENIIIEHNYLHDIASEGMYLGVNVYMPGNVKPIRYIKVRYNDAVDIGWECFQGKRWYGGTAGEGGATDNEVHGNVFLGCGWNINHDNDQCGLSLIGGIGNIHDNWVEDAGDVGIQSWDDTLRDAGTPPPFTQNEVRIYNNVVVRAGRNGATVGGKHGITVGGAGLANAGTEHLAKVYSNTVIGSYDKGIQVSGVAASYAKNNISVDNGGTDVAAPINLYNTTGASTGLFVDAVGSYGATDFHLNAALAAGGSAGDYAADDYNGTPRVAPDRGAFEK